MISAQINELILRLKVRQNNMIELLKSGGYSTPEILEKPNITKKRLDFSLNIKNLAELKVACILDEFSFACYSPECNFLELTPDNWKVEIDGFLPDLLFVESAWGGKDKLWYRKISHCTEEFIEMTAYCRERKIPIVFWNKEDPVYTEQFMLAAMHCDVVFTTDIECIPKYKAALGHNYVYHLHFAAQPKMHNPINKYERKDKFCFAGAYYRKYVERTKVFDSFAKVFDSFKGFDIYDRNIGVGVTEHHFPTRYEKNIVGGLPANEIDKAYKGYFYGVNMNSIQQSQTMFARRLFEMLASNTVTVGNYSRGVKTYFGDLTICTDSEKTLQTNLENYCKDDITRDKYRLLGLRAVLSDHLYADRLDYVVQKIFGKSIKKQLPDITVFAVASNRKNAERLIDMFEAQAYKNRLLVLVYDEQKEKLAVNVESVTIITSQQAEQASITDFTKTSFTTVFSEHDYYGKNYLQDLALATRYYEGIAIGKAAYFDRTNPENMHKTYDNTKTYKDGEVLARRRAIYALDLIKTETISQLFSGEDLQGLSIDPFNYCQNCKTAYEAVDDLHIADVGIPLSQLIAVAENIQMPISYSSDNVLAADILATLFPAQVENKQMKIMYKSTGIVFNSNLSEENHEYIYFNKMFDKEQLCGCGNAIKLLLIGTASCDAMLVVRSVDVAGKPIKASFVKLNRSFEEEMPKEMAKIQLGIRIRGTGSFELKKIIFGDEDVEVNEDIYLPKSNILVLTNQYPDSENLYRNAFVHQRVLNYVKNGTVCDVMKMNIYAKDRFYEFEGINVTEGQGSRLYSILSSGMVDTVCVHFLDANMWSVLKSFLGKIRIIVWVHGSEIQPWWRREYNYTTEAEKANAKTASDERTAFWKEIFNHVPDKNLHFVFVSNYFANEVMEDNNIQLPKESYSIIHNVIDTEIFEHVKKEENARCKILSIKSYSTRTYATDITTKAIVSISKHPAFNQLEFYICGNGELFDSDTDPLKQFKNVHLHKGFFTKSEIYDMHKKCGVYIATTRMDSQGVSRDEAMSSGLVPIANNVAAIPEFVDENCGIIVPPEDYEAVGQAIINIYENPELFLQLSKNAARRVRKQTSADHTILRELELIKG